MIALKYILKLLQIENWEVLIIKNLRIIKNVTKYLKIKKYSKICILL